MSYYSVDVETDGPIIGINSMVCFGIVKVEPKLIETFYGQVRPISEVWDPRALAISGFSRLDHAKFDEPVDVIDESYKWILKTNTHSSPILISDNNGYDFAWMNYYYLRYAPSGKNPFGWSSRRIGDIYCGMMKDSRASWKHLRKTKHTHNPVDDAMGNAEALLEMQKMGLKIDFK